MSQPTAAELQALIDRHGNNVAIANHLGVSEWTIRQWRKQHGIKPSVSNGGSSTTGSRTHGPEPVSFTFSADGISAVLPPTEKLNLGQIEEFIREHGLDPADWVIVTQTINKWQGMTGKQRDNELVWLRQIKVTLKPAPRLIFNIHAEHVPAIKLPKRPPATDRPALVVIEGDHQIPYHDPQLHIASLYALKDMFKRHNMRRHVFLGDTGDYPTISKHGDHPTAMAPTKKVNQRVYDKLREKREAAPVDQCDKLEGNHDFRVKAELLTRAERMYDMTPAQEWENTEPELPWWHLRRALHLDKLGITFHEDPRGWQHASVELVPGPYGLEVRHGWLTGTNTADRTLTKLGRSSIVGHIHQRDHVFRWNPSLRTEQQLVVAGAMCLVRGGMSEDGDPFPHFAPEDNWTQGFVTASIWPDGDFLIEHAIWDGKTLRWRDQRWTA